MTNLDILVGNQMMSMYSENENMYWNGVEQEMFEELKEDDEG